VLDVDKHKEERPTRSVSRTREEFSGANAYLKSSFPFSIYATGMLEATLIFSSRSDEGSHL